MPPKFGGGARCGRCEKLVYAAEEMKALGKSYHKLCFKCKSCNKLLDSTNCTDKDNELFCKTCYAKTFGPQGYGYGQGAGTLVMYTQQMTISDDAETKPSPAPGTNEEDKPGADTNSADTRAEERSSTPEPEAKVEPAEKAEDAPAPAPQPEPTQPRAATPENSATDDSEGAPPKRSVSAARAAFEKPANNDLCPRCKKVVYFAEKCLGAGRTWHKICFRCNDCGKQLDSFASEREGDFYCKGCYAKKFGPKGYGYGGTLQYTGQSAN